MGATARNLWNSIGYDSGLPGGVWVDWAGSGASATANVSTSVLQNSDTDLHSLALYAPLGEHVTVKTQPFFLPETLRTGALLVANGAATLAAGSSGRATLEVVWYDKEGTELSSSIAWIVILSSTTWGDVFPLQGVGTSSPDEVAYGFKMTWLGGLPSGGTSYWSLPQLGVPGANGENWNPVWL